MLKIIAAAVAAAQFVVPAAAQPRLNVESTCRAMAKFADAARGFDQCMKDEQDAHAELQKTWGKYAAAEHTRCVGLTKIGGDLPSYVEVLTCLQMGAAAKEPLNPLR
jgi:hypothetical protein